MYTDARRYGRRWSHETFYWVAVLPRQASYDAISLAVRAASGVIAHPTYALFSTGNLAASTNRSTPSTEARFAFAVLTTERKAA